MLNTFDKVVAAPLMPETPTYEYLRQAESIVTFELDEDNGYYVMQNRHNGNTSSSDNININNGTLFGENVLTEDCIMQFFMFRNKSVKSSNRVSHKISFLFRTSISSRVH